LKISTKKYAGIIDSIIIGISVGTKVERVFIKASIEINIKVRRIAVITVRMLGLVTSTDDNLESGG
jgi:hypothetical protein